MGEEVEELKRRARPHDIASLRRLDRALQRVGWRVEGKTIREWISEFSHLPEGYVGVDPDPIQLVRKAGLAAVPALLETLRTKQLSPKRELDRRIRMHCLEALERMDPAPVCAVPALLETLHHPSTHLRCMTLWVLADLRPRPSGVAVRELLTCLRSKHEPRVRIEAARALSRLDGAIPLEIRQAAIERLTDPHPRVRRYVLRLLARVPAPDPELRAALEEQVILDDANRTDALLALLEFDAPHALELLREEILLAPNAHWTPERIELRTVRALQLVARLGARAEPTLPAVRRAAIGARFDIPVRVALDSIARSQLSARMPAPSPEQLRDERARKLLEPVVPREPSESLARALARWAAGFTPHGRELCVRMALAAGRRVVGLWESEYPLHYGPREALFAMEEWVCDASQLTARQAVRAGNLVPSQLSAPGAFAASWAITFATLCTPTEEERAQWAPHEHPMDSVEGGFLGTAVYSACRALQSRSVVAFALGPSEEPTILSEKEAVHEVRKAIVDELLPWVCGTWDPVTDVVRHRQELLGPRQQPERREMLTGRYPP
jgi:hypothetical protein